MEANYILIIAYECLNSFIFLLSSKRQHILGHFHEYELSSDDVDLGMQPASNSGRQHLSSIEEISDSPGLALGCCFERVIEVISQQ